MDERLNPLKISLYHYACSTEEAFLQEFWEYIEEMKMFHSYRLFPKDLCFNIILETCFHYCIEILNNALQSIVIFISQFFQYSYMNDIDSILDCWK